MSDNSPWWVAIVAGVPSVGSGAWVAWRWWIERNDKRQTDHLTREQLLQHDLDAQRAAASKEAADIFDRVKLELARRDTEAIRKDDRIDALDREVDHWVNVARGWQTRAFTLKHQLSHARQEYNSLLFRSGEPGKTWEEPPELPNTLEGPKNDAA